MRCPVDNETLVMADRGGVEIDYCPKCRGVWLDRGELDKIIERSAAQAPAHAVMAPAVPSTAAAPVYQQEPRHVSQHPDAPQSRGRGRDDDDDDHRHGKRYRKRESFLGELFDF